MMTMRRMMLRTTTRTTQYRTYQTLTQQHQQQQQQNGLNILSMRMIKLSVIDPNTIQRNKSNVNSIKFESLPVLAPRTIQSSELVNEWLDSIDGTDTQTFLVNVKDVPQLCQQLAMNRERSDAQITERTRHALDETSKSSALVSSNATNSNDLVSVVAGFDQAEPVPLNVAFESDYRLQVNRRTSTALVQPDRLPLLSSNEKQLFDLIVAGSITPLQEFLKRNPDVDVDVQHPSHGGTSLHVAALYNHVDIIRMLIEEYQADVNARALNGSTPLHWAAGNCNIEACETLLSNKSDPLILTSTWFSNSVGRGSGQAAIHWAAESGHIDLVNLLNHYSPASLAALDERGRTPKDLALSEGHVETAKLLSEISREKYVAIKVQLMARSNLTMNSNHSHKTNRREYPKFQR